MIACSCKEHKHSRCRAIKKLRPSHLVSARMTRSLPQEAELLQDTNRCSNRRTSPPRYRCGIGHIRQGKASCKWSDSTRLQLPIAPDQQVTQTPHADISLGHNVQNGNASPCRKHYNRSGANFQHCPQRLQVYLQEEQEKQSWYLLTPYPSVTNRGRKSEV